MCLMNRSFALDLNPRLSGGGPLAVGSVLFEARLASFFASLDLSTCSDNIQICFSRHSWQSRIPPFSKRSFISSSKRLLVLSILHSFLQRYPPPLRGFLPSREDLRSGPSGANHSIHARTGVLMAHDSQTHG